MQRSFEGKRNSLEGVCMLLQETAQIVTSRLLYCGQWEEADPICQTDLLLVWARVQVPLEQLETIKQLIKKLTKQDVKEEFWDRRVKECSHPC